MHGSSTCAGSLLLPVSTHWLHGNTYSCRAYTLSFTTTRSTSHAESEIWEWVSEWMRSEWVSECKWMNKKEYMDIFLKSTEPFLRWYITWLTSDAQSEILEWVRNRTIKWVSEWMSERVTQSINQPVDKWVCRWECYCEWIMNEWMFTKEHFLFGVQFFSPHHHLLGSLSLI